MAVAINNHGSGNRILIPESMLASQSGTIILDGDDNLIVIGDGSTLRGARIHLGSNCSFECGRDCGLASIEVFAVSGGHIRIGDGTGFTWNARLLLHEASEISLGRGCLIAADTTFSVSDMHSIVDLATGRRLNPAKSIQLGDRVWLGERVRVWKGVTIGAGSIIGTESLVTGAIPPNCIAAGAPARVIREGVTWRADLIAAGEQPEARVGPRRDAPSAVAASSSDLTSAASVIDEPLLRESIEFLVGRVARNPDTFVTDIHPDDDLLRFGRDTFGAEDSARLTYFRYGAWIVSAYSQIAEWRYGGLQHVPRMLEFACGFGRQTRYLVQEMPKERIWCAAFDPRATAFVHSRFGVNTIVSSESADGMGSQTPFDLITVTSLLGHLPRHTFTVVVESMLQLLAPGGLLAFSVHDQVVHPSGQVPEDGFLFVPNGESTRQKSHEIGTTFVSEAFVRECIERIMGPRWPYARLPRGLGSHQDLYLVGNDPNVRLDGLRFRRGPEGCVDRCERGPAGDVTLSGWVGDPDEPDGGAQALVMLDGHLAECCEQCHPRDDVAAVLCEPRYRTAGWRCTLGAGLRPSSTIEVIAVARDGRRRLLLAGCLGSLLDRRLC